VLYDNRVPVMPHIFDTTPLEALRAALDLFASDHALSRFDWGKSALRAQDIRELNETPLKIRAAIAKIEEAPGNGIGDR
jgi:hypothetical protein